MIMFGGEKCVIQGPDDIKIREVQCMYWKSG